MRRKPVLTAASPPPRAITRNKARAVQFAEPRRARVEHLRADIERSDVIDAANLDAVAGCLVTRQILRLRI